MIRVSLGIRGRRLRPGLVREREPGCGTVFGFDYLRRNGVQIGRFYANQAGAERVDTGSGNGGLDTPVSGLVEWTGDGEMEREGRVNDRVEDSDSANVVESSETPNETPDESPAPDTVRAFKDREKQLEERGIMQIAMAGSSRRVREESGDAIRGKLSEVAIRSELKWLKDPRALADRVARLLNVDDLASAAGMVRMAQKQKRPCVVAWNHIFEYTLKKNVPAAAFRFYNDVSFVLVRVLGLGCADSSR